MQMYREKLRIEAPSGEKSPLHESLHCEHTFELTLIIHSCF